MGVHAQLSPSSADRWMSCPGSVALCENIPDTTSAASEEGTMLHDMAADCLIYDVDPTTSNNEHTPLYDLNDEQAIAVKTYIDIVRDIKKSVNGELYVEQRLPISWLTNEPDAYGTADAVICSEDELVIIDAKFGRGVVVEAERNKQLMIYALAANDNFKLAYDFKRIRLVISQPRLGACLEWTLTPGELEIFSGEVMLAASYTNVFEAPLVPSPKACQWCRAKANCPAIKEIIMSDFDTIKPESASDDDLSNVMDNAGMIESWVKAVRAEVERRLLSGEPVKGYKLVKGKKGNRQWANDAEAEAALKAMRIKHDVMYSYSLVTPTTIEKLAKAEEIGPRQWSKIQQLITQSEGRPSVAPASDKRPELALSADVSDFDDISTGE